MQGDLFGSTEEDESTCDTKVCKDCGEAKPLSDYYNHPNYTGNLFHRCKTCQKKKQADRRAVSKTCPPKSECCDNCGKYTTDIHMDHCHETLKFRGWLCRSCNTGIGSLGDNIEGLERAIEYLRRTNASI